MRIDADAHVDETEATWEFLDEAGRRFLPETVDAPNGARDKRWRTDGVEFRRPVRDYRRTGASPETGQLLDVGARLRHLDELRIDIQVLYPTMFIRSVFADHEELELALTRSYNRWIAARTEESGGRLRWVAVLPMLSIDEAVKELQWATQHGACGVFKKGAEAGNRSVSDPHFFPLYEAADELNVPICIHTGSDGFNAMLAPSALDAVRAFDPIVTSDLPDKFPSLRFGIIEASASWVPFLLTNIAGSGRRDHLQAIDPNQRVAIDLELFRRSRVYVACQSHDDLPYILQFGMEDNLLVGTDYTHADQSAELQALDRVGQRAASGEISAEAARKILDDNPRAFYGL